MEQHSVSGCRPNVDSSISSACLARDLSEAIAENEVTSSSAAVCREPQVDKTASVYYQRSAAPVELAEVCARVPELRHAHEVPEDSMTTPLSCSKGSIIRYVSLYWDVYGFWMWCHTAATHRKMSCCLLYIRLGNHDGTTISNETFAGIFSIVLMMWDSVDCN